MFVVDEIQVFQRDLAFLGSLPLFGPFVAFISTASQVDDLCLLDFYHGLKAFVERIEDLKLALLHVS